MQFLSVNIWCWLCSTVNKRCIKTRGKPTSSLMKLLCQRKQTDQSRINKEPLAAETWPACRAAPQQQPLLFSHSKQGRWWLMSFTHLNRGRPVCAAPRTSCCKQARRRPPSQHPQRVVSSRHSDPLNETTIYCRCRYVCVRFTFVNTHTHILQVIDWGQSGAAVGMPQGRRSCIPWKVWGVF